MGALPHSTVPLQEDVGNMGTRPASLEAGHVPGCVGDSFQRQKRAVVKERGHVPLLLKRDMSPTGVPDDVAYPPPGLI